MSQLSRVQREQTGREEGAPRAGAEHMGRAKYSDEKRTKIIDTFLNVTRDVIDGEGIESVSIRKVAACAGYNSATLYLYFSNVDELITMAAVSYLEDYCSMLSKTIDPDKSPLQIYLYTWRVFCRFLTIHPKTFYQLFFATHTKPLDETVQRYYEIYPRQLENTNESIHGMLSAGELSERNLEVLRPLVGVGTVTEENVELINELTVSYFRTLLERRTQHMDDYDLSDDSLNEQMRVVNRFLLGLN